MSRVRNLVLVLRRLLDGRDVSRDRERHLLQRARFSTQVLCTELDGPSRGCLVRCGKRPESTGWVSAAIAFTAGTQAILLYTVAEEGSTEGHQVT